MDDHDLIAKPLASLKDQGVYNTISTMLSASRARREPDFAPGKLALAGQGLAVIGR